MNVSGLKKYYLVGFSTAAIIAFTSFVFYQTQSFYMHFARGQHLIRSQRYQEAQDVLLKALEIAPNDIRSLQYIFLTDEKLKTDRGAKKTYQILEKADVSNVPLGLYVADSFYSDAYYEQAERVYKNLVSQDENWAIKKKLAEVLLWQKKYDEAIMLLEDIIQQVPDHIQTKRLFADALFWNHNYERAVEMYHQLLGTEGQNQEMVLNLAEALRLSGKDREAIEVYDTFLEKQ